MKKFKDYLAPVISLFSKKYVGTEDTDENGNGKKYEPPRFRIIEEVDTSGVTTSTSASSKKINIPIN